MGAGYRSADRFESFPDAPDVMRGECGTHFDAAAETIPAYEWGVTRHATSHTSNPEKLDGAINAPPSTLQLPLMELQDEVKRAAERARGAPVRFVEAVPVVETYRGAVVWEGPVSEFESAVGKVYAWAVDGLKAPQYVARIHDPSASSPVAAVRAWLASQVRK
jgi:hypothetical protein